MFSGSTDEQSRSKSPRCSTRQPPTTRDSPGRSSGGGAAGCCSALQPRAANRQSIRSRRHESKLAVCLEVINADGYWERQGGLPGAYPCFIELQSSN